MKSWVVMRVVGGGDECVAKGDLGMYWELQRLKVRQLRRIEGVPSQ